MAKKVLIGYFWMTGKFYLGVMLMLLQPKVPVTFRLERDGLAIWMGGDVKSYRWANVAELQEQGRLNVLWFYDGGVVPVPGEVISREALRGYLDFSVSEA